MAKQDNPASRSAATHMVPRRDAFAALGTIVSTAPKAALLLALRQLRPQDTIRLQRLPGSGPPRYRVELRPEQREPGAIDMWLRIKSALMAAFPADKPNAVAAFDR